MNKTEEELTYSQIRYRKIKADPKLMKKRREINNKYEKSEKGKEAKKKGGGELLKVRC